MILINQGKNSMKPHFLITLLLAADCFVAASTIADSRNGDDDARPLTVAVFGDWPYNQLLLDNAPLLINSVNADPKVGLVIHVGDIHSGSAACTSAGILPPIPASNPGWNQGVYYQFQQFKDPLVYTPGDNEWTDCHKSRKRAVAIRSRNWRAYAACSSPGPGIPWA